MTCGNCGQNSPDGANFCEHCGARFDASPPDGDGALSPEQVAPEQAGPEEAAQVLLDEGVSPALVEQLQAIQTALNALRADLGHQADRLQLVERVLAVPRLDPATRAPVAPEAAPARPAAAESPARPAPSASGAGGVAPPAGPAAAHPPEPASLHAPPSARATPPPSGRWAALASGAGSLGGGWDIGGIRSWDWEWLFGGNWLARIGVLALIIGVGFFLKLAFDNDWIGETGRVVLGLGGGVALLGGGEYWRRKYPIWAQPLTGGGLAVLYLAIFAAFSFYELIPALPALGFLFLVTVTAAALAVRYESAVIALLGILSGFATPFLLVDRVPDQRALLAYVLVLDLGVLALATFRNWRWFTLLGLLGSIVLLLYWLENFDPDILLAEIGATAVFLIFVAATTLFHLLWRRVPGPADQALMLLNGAAYFGISYQIMFDEYREWMGGFTVLLALFFGLLGYGVLLRHREQVVHSLFALAVAVVFLTIAVPVQLDGPWVSVAWAVEGVVLVWLSLILRMHQLRWFGLGAFVIFGVWIVAIDTPYVLDAGLRPFFNFYTIAYAAATGACYVGAYLLYRYRSAVMTWEQHLLSGFLISGNLFLTLATPAQASGPWIAIVWAVEALLLLALSFRLGLIELRVFSLGVFAITVVRLLTFDTFDVQRDDLFRPIINERFLGFAVGIAAFYLAAFAVWWWREKYVHEREKYLLAVFIAAASLLTLWILSAEIISSVESDYFDVPPGIAGNVTSLSLSILWAVYAAILIVAGIVMRWRWVRLAGLGLLAVPVLKLFLVDTFSLEREYRVAAYLVLGILLVAGGFLYQRYSRAIRGFLLE